MQAKSITSNKSSLLKSAIVAIVAATVVLLVAVLPAEYNIDPTGLGKLMRLTNLAQASDKVTEAPATIADFAVSNSHQEAARDQTIDILLKPYDEVEYKAILPKGEPMLYNWSTSQGDVYYDFHGEPSNSEEYEEGYFESYEQGDATSAQGSFIAPFAGNHGWYWLNYNDFDVTIRLRANGYYQDIVELYRNNQLNPR